MTHTYAVRAQCPLGYSRSVVNKFDHALSPLAPGRVRTIIRLAARDRCTREQTYSHEGDNTNFYVIFYFGAVQVAS
jgi:hypothetical protein